MYDPERRMYKREKAEPPSFRHIMLRCDDCCEDCAVQAASAMLGEWLVIL